MARRTYAPKHREFIDGLRHLYDDILDYQDGHCALCTREPSERRRLDMDHRHKEPMMLRGLLCHKCNRALKDWMDKSWLIRAANYVERDITKEI